MWLRIEVDIAASVSCAVLFGICCDAKARPFPLHELAFYGCLLCLSNCLASFK
jgi:hypothetical protein